MKKSLVSLLLIVITNTLFGQAANNTCTSAENLLILGNTPTTHSSTLYLANNTTIGTCGNRADVWYRFQMPAWSNTAVIRVSLASTQTLTTGNTYVEFFNPFVCTPLSGTTINGCNNISQPRAFTAAANGTFYFRINTTAAVNGTPANYNFTVSVVAVPDGINNATLMQPGVSNYLGATIGATASAGNPVVPGTTCAGTPDDDVWYKFVAGATNATIYMTSPNNNGLNVNGPRIQVFRGSTAGVGTLVSIGCATTQQLNLTGLTAGDTCFMRIFSNAAAAPAGTVASVYEIGVSPLQPAVVGSGRMKEVFRQINLSPPNLLADPWEITYGPDDRLWITESKGYRVYRMDPVTGAKTTVLDISQGSTFLPVGDQPYNCQFANGAGAQGGLAGLVLHPNFLHPVTPKNYVYISYIHSTTTAQLFTNRVVRFTYNTGTGLLGSPVTICDTLPGSNDHNSQRMIIAPVVKGGTPYLFYASGDMGAGQGNAFNITRPIKSQYPNSYEGKILRFNLEQEASDLTPSGWIPDDNPYNALLGVQSAVWNIGQRNNQGFAYDTSLNKLYGSSHGPYSDDEINVMEPFRNYGHPLVVGMVADTNYNGTRAIGTNLSISAGAPFPTGSGISSNPPIGDERLRRDTINMGPNGQYKDPLFTAYPGATGTGPGSVTYIWQNNPNNGTWPSEGWSGLDIYSNSKIPGWKKSLVAASLKWGRLVRLKLEASGEATMPNNTINDTVSYFGSQNRFRDLTFAPNGKDIYVVMDRSTTTSGPSALFPVVPSCQGCVQKYTFLGYHADGGNGNRSYIPNTIPVAAGKLNVFERANQVVINAAQGNTNIWVPITDTSSNIIAEIHAQGRTLDTVTTYLYTRTGASRIRSGKKYMNRNLTITPKQQPGGDVLIRLYISKQEYDDFVTDGYAGSPAGIKILKNTDSCLTTISTTPLAIPPPVAEVFGTDNGYVFQATINTFSSFYFSNDAIILPTELLTFKGSLQNNATLLQWETADEVNTKHFDVERSIDGRNFDRIGTVNANGSYSKYSNIDNDIMNLSVATVYYRLKMVDADAETKYSNVVTINLTDLVGKILLSPNPANDETRVTFKSNSNGKAQWKLMDNSGRVIMRSNFQVNKGNNNFAINLSGLAGGIYYLNVSGAGMEQNLKLQKL